MAGKWLETLKLIAPDIVRIGAIRDLASPSEMGMLGAIQALIPAFAMPFVAVGGRDAAEFERAIEGFAREPNGGLIILPSPNTLVHRRAIMALAARLRLPAIYPYGFFAREGGLLSYGIVPSDNFRRAAAYVDRILKGAKPGEMPVQVPTKFELVLNLKTAKTLGLEESPRALLHALQCNSSCNRVRARHVTVMHSIARSLLEYANNARRRRRRVSPTVASCVARSVRKREQQGKRLV
jgi:putative tryptophan/tyrosine transport system substrate-binding protein